MKKDIAKKLAEIILEEVGGKDNVSNVLHCTTRLRFNLKDESIPNENKINDIEGVFGCHFQSNQFQIIIGPEVGDVYHELCAMGGFENKVAIDEVLDEDIAPKAKLSLKQIGKNILDVLSSCLTPVLPLIIGSSMFKMILSVFGADGFGLISAESTLFTLFTFVGDAGFYFLPVAVGYAAAKKFNSNVMNALLLSFVMLHPTFGSLVGQPFDVYGIPCNVQNYANTIVPIILSVWIMSYVEKLLKRFIPKSFELILSTALTIAIMLPISLCVLGPAGSFAGNYIAKFLFLLKEVGGPIGVAAIAGVYTWLVMSGMHLILVTQIILNLSVGTDPYLLGTLWCWAVAVVAVPAAIFVKSKKPETKSLALTCFTSGITAGVSEPTLFGLVLKYKKPFYTLMIGAFAGGLLSGILGVPCNSIGCAFVNFVGVFSWITSSTQETLFNFAVSCAVSFIVTFVLTYKFGYSDEMEQ